MKLLIAGGRDFTNRDVFNLALKRFLGCHPEITELVSGMAKGADTLGIEWAKSHNIPIKEFPYLSAFGKSGGPIRNKAMAEYLAGKGVALIFWDGKSRGTKNMIQNLDQLKIPTTLYRY